MSQLLFPEQFFLQVSSCGTSGTMSTKLSAEMLPSNLTLHAQLSCFKPVTQLWQLLLFAHLEKSRQASFRGWPSVLKKVNVVQVLFFSHSWLHSASVVTPMQVWMRLSPWISHSSLSTKQSRRRHRAKGMGKERNMTRFASWAAIPDCCAHVYQSYLVSFENAWILGWCWWILAWCKRHRAELQKNWIIRKIF